MSIDSLAAIGVRRVGEEWHNPERNQGGEIVGTSRRLPTGKKLAIEGSKRGLALRWPLDPYAGTSADDPILIVEGASDTAAGLDLGFETVGRPSATGGLADLSGLLAGRHVVIVAENDKAGLGGAEKIAAGLAGVAASVRAILPPEGCKDLRAWLGSADRDTVRAEIRSAIGLADPYEPAAADESPARGGRGGATAIMRRASEIESKPVRWLWRNRIPFGKVTVIAGDPGLGKSFVTIDIIARATGGWGWPGDGQPGEQRLGAVLYNAEDDPEDTIRPRLDAAEADCDRVTILEGVRNPDGSVKGFTLDELDVLEQAIDDTPDCGLVVIDPLGAVFGEADSHRDSDVRALMAPLSALAARKGVAIVLVAHLNKAQARKAIHRLTGSLAVVAAARMGWLVAEDPNDKDRRMMVNIKANIARGSSGLAFRIEGDGVPRIEWESGEVSMTADELLEALGDDGARSELDEAVEFLRSELADGPCPASEIEKSAKSAMIALSTLKRAKKHLRVASTKRGMDGGWDWSLPEGCQNGRRGPSLNDGNLRAG
ncbi:MAG: AAA family ATPase [Phycisphaerales bacterium]|nr:AAA family ATPase [Phycisphaerales bacterium]